MDRPARAGCGYAPRCSRCSRRRGQTKFASAGMIQPDFKSFCKLAQQGNLVPVYETFTADLLTPVGAHLRLAHKAKYSFLLESVEGGENLARYTFTGANPEEVFRSRGRACSLESGRKQTQLEGDPIEHLRRLVARYKPVRVVGLPPLMGGAIGYFAYDMVRLIERIPASGRDDLGLDDCVMMFYLGLVAFDHVRHRVWIVRNVFTEGEGTLRAKYDAAIREISKVRRTLSGPVPRQHHAPPRRRYFSGGPQPALFCANECRSFRNLSRAARRESIAVSLFFKARRCFSCRQFAGNAGEGAGTRSRLSSNCRNAAPRAQ